MRESRRNNRYFRLGLTLFLSLSAVILVYVLLTRLSGLAAFLKALGKTLSPVVYGLAFAYLLCSPMNFFEGLFLRAFKLPAYDPLAVEEAPVVKRRRLCRTLAVLIVFLLVGLIIWAFFALMLPRLGESIGTLISNSDTYYSTVDAWVMKLLENNPTLVDGASGVLDKFEVYLTDFISNTVAPKVQTLIASVTSSVIGMVVGTVNVLIGFIIAVYVLFSKDAFLRQAKKLVRAVFSDKKAYWIMDITRHAHEYFGKFLVGKIIDSAFIGLLCFIGCTLLQIPYTLLISVIVGLTNIIPFFGPFIGGIPCAFLVLMAEPIRCVYFAIFILALQQLDGNVIGPKILGDRINVSAFWIVVSILLFGKLFGFVGMIIGVPCFAVINYIVTTLVDRRLAARGLSDRQVQREDFPDLPPDYIPAPAVEAEPSVETEEPQPVPETVGASGKDDSE